MSNIKIFLLLSKRLVPVVVLYVGRVGTAALGLLILPWLSLVMPAEQFGLAVTVLSLQSLAIVLDLGLSITISRELPVVASARTRISILQRCERSLVLFYCIITTIALIFSAFGIITTHFKTVLLICFSVLLVVWQNILVTAFISRQQFLFSTISQLVSIAFRLGTTLAIVIFYDNRLEYFVIGNILGSIFILLPSRLTFFLQNSPDKQTAIVNQLPFASNILIVIYTIAGACALQADKLLISALVYPALTGPYFLASLLSLIPITFLASPVSQFIQPKLIVSLEFYHQKEAQRLIVGLTIAIFALAVLPGLVAGLYAPYLIPLWLQGAPQQAAVINYVTLLMPGASFGALGLVPAIVLIYRRDYRALAIMSCTLTCFVLSITVVLAQRGSINGICIAYALYHVAAAAALWWRAWQIEPIFANSFGFYPNAA